MATRKAYIPMQKMTEQEMLKMVVTSTDNGFAVPAKLLLSASTFKTVARMFDAGYLAMQTTAFGVMYTITETGRQAAQ